MKKRTITGVLAAVLLITAGTVVFKKNQSVSIIGGADGPTTIFITGKQEAAVYQSISMEEAQAAFELDGSYVILDVRRADEYAEGHIPGAINIANEDIQDKEPDELPVKDQIIYVYCRSGRRSVEAATKLAALGYTNVIECGGILDWTGDIEK
ncbi:MAG: rhodanese-like domain-containing protein [Lachnospiraceae bacterium]|nr:rhodanese-like domain-containing protein [Lachnospiraceae bacterium]